MRDRRFDHYLTLLRGLLPMRPERREAIAEELRAHLEEMVADLTARGVPPDEAAARALDDFGDAARLAGELSKVFRYRRRRWTMRVSLAGLTISLGLIFAAAVLWPDPNQAPLPVLNQAAAQLQEDEAAPPPAPAPEPSDEQRLRAALNQPVEAYFVETPLREVLEYLSQLAGIQIYADWRRLKELEVTPDSPVTFELRGVSLDMVLDLILGQLADGIATNQREGVLIITTADALADQMETRVYRVSNLLDGQDPRALSKLRQLVASTIAPGTWNAPRVIHRHGGGMGGMSAGMGMSGGMMGSAPGGPAGMSGMGMMPPPAAMGEEGMMPHMRISGGAPAACPDRKLGSLETYRGNLVVRHTPAVQEQVRQLLDQLAEAKLEANAPTAGGSYGEAGMGMGVF